MDILLPSIANSKSVSTGSSQTFKLERVWLASHLALLLLSAALVWSSLPPKVFSPAAKSNPKRFIGADLPSQSSRNVSNRPRYITAPYVEQESQGMPCVEPNGSEVWELSSRHLPEKFRCINTANPGLGAQRHTSTGWQSENLENALVNDGRLVILYVHGNFMERNNARERVLILNRYLQERADRPYRLLMLSWPSTREPHPLRDVYENAESAECQALFVGWLLERLAEHPDVSLLGFSFGARAVTGGLHLASGGSIPGFHYQSISNPQAMSPKYRVALVAPALDRDWLASGGRHQRGLDNVTGLINLYNSKDPILRRFRFIDRLSRPVAAGFAGFIGIQGLDGVSDPRATGPLANSAKIRQFDCVSGIGTTHSERSYYSQCPYFGLVLEHLLGQESHVKSIE